MMLLNAALRLLPVEARARYREEMQADLAEIVGLGRVTYLLGVLLTAPALGFTLRRRKVGLDGHRIRLRCRLGMHHWQLLRTTDGQSFRRCDRCGADNDGTSSAVAGTLAGTVTWPQ